MADIEDDPWADLRKASSRVPEAGQFAYQDEPPEAAQATPWQWIKLWFFVDFLGWLKRQVPLASQSLDSTYYLGFTRKRKIATNTVKKVLGKESEEDQVRTPIIFGGRRIGVPGTLLAVLALCLVIYIVRSVFGV